MRGYNQVEMETLFQHLERIQAAEVKEAYLFLVTEAKSRPNYEVGVQDYRTNRGFSSTTGMRYHIRGLISFAHRVDQKYAAKLYAGFGKIKW